MDNYANEFIISREARTIVWDNKIVLLIVYNQCAMLNDRNRLANGTLPKLTPKQWLPLLLALSGCSSN